MFVQLLAPVSSVMRWRCRVEKELRRRTVSLLRRRDTVPARRLHPSVHSMHEGVDKVLASLAGLLCLVC
jgi:hypothetical protein